MFGRAGRKKEAGGRTPPVCVPPPMLGKMGEEGEEGVRAPSEARGREVTPEEVRVWEMSAELARVRERLALPLRARVGVGVGPMGSL